MFSLTKFWFNIGVRIFMRWFSPKKSIWWNVMFDVWCNKYGNLLDLCCIRWQLCIHYILKGLICMFERCDVSLTLRSSPIPLAAEQATRVPRSPGRRRGNKSRNLRELSQGHAGAAEETSSPLQITQLHRYGRHVKRKHGYHVRKRRSEMLWPLAFRWFG